MYCVLGFISQELQDFLVLFLGVKVSSERKRFKVIKLHNHFVFLPYIQNLFESRPPYLSKQTDDSFRNGISSLKSFLNVGRKGSLILTTIWLSGSNEVVTYNDVCFLLSFR